VAVRRKDDATVERRIHLYIHIYKYMCIYVNLYIHEYACVHIQYIYNKRTWQAGSVAVRRKDDATVERLSDL